MKRYVALHYLPGSAGNFLSRCINLLDDTYVWAKDKKLPQTLDEKYNWFTYKNIQAETWIEFEDRLSPWNADRPHWDISNNGVAVYVTHPLSVDVIKTCAGNDDLAINIYIDCKNNLEWCIINGWHKHSHQMLDWIQFAELLDQDPEVYKINLSNIINGYDQFLSEFIKLSTFLDRIVTPEIENILHKLYLEWVETTVSGVELENQRKLLARTLEFLKKLSGNSIENP